MNYKAKPIELGFGKGVAISRGSQTYEQISARDGLTVRLYKAPCRIGGQINDDYHGIILRPSFSVTEQDFQVFKNLTDRLAQVSGVKIRNAKSNFMNYISHSGLEQKLEKINIQLRYNRHETYFRQETQDFINEKSYLGGLVTTLFGYAAGFMVVAHVASPEEASLALITYGMATPVFEGMFGLCVAMVFEEFWCGPMHAPGFIASRIAHKRKVHDPDYILDCFMENYQKLDAMKDAVGNQKQFSRLSKKADRFYRLIQELFPLSPYQKGFSIHYQNPDRENVVELFSYILEGGNVPQLRVQAKKRKKQKTLPCKVRPVQTDFIDPWEIEIPRLGDKK